jgi:hypothetical protein
MDDLEKAVMEILWDTGLQSTVFKGIEQCRQDIAEIQKRKTWARSLPWSDGSRKYYLKWLDYFERRHRERIAEQEAAERVAKLTPSVSKYPG